MATARSGDFCRVSSLDEDEESLVGLSSHHNNRCEECIIKSRYIDTQRCRICELENTNYVVEYENWKRRETALQKVVATLETQVKHVLDNNQTYDTNEVKKLQIELVRSTLQLNKYLHREAGQGNAATPPVHQNVERWDKYISRPTQTEDDDSRVIENKLSRVVQENEELKENIAALEKHFKMKYEEAQETLSKTLQDCQMKDHQIDNLKSELFLKNEELLKKPVATTDGGLDYKELYEHCRAQLDQTKRDYDELDNKYIQEKKRNNQRH